MAVNAHKTELKDILYLRSLFLQENNFQIRYNACHERGWTDSYMITYNNLQIGYGAIKGKEDLKSRDTVFEFYIIPPFQRVAAESFIKLLTVSGATFIECQTNDNLLAALIYRHAEDVKPQGILFEENEDTSLQVNEAIFRARAEGDVIFKHHSEPPGNFVVEYQHEVVATGGFFTHYNMPFADLFMEVREDARRKGIGSFLIQEIKTQCYLAGRVPAARCGMSNPASKATLLRAGFKVAGYLLLGNVKR